MRHRGSNSPCNIRGGEYDWLTPSKSPRRARDGHTIQCGLRTDAANLRVEFVAPTRVAERAIRAGRWARWNTTTDQPPRAIARTASCRATPVVVQAEV
jgi:hypothetical protein